MHGKTKATAMRAMYRKYFAPTSDLLAPPKEADARVIKVNDIVSKASFFYEKIRNALDYSEEHLLRKNAIARIISRRMFFQTETEDLAEALILELIRARYLPNERLSENIIPVIGRIIEKYHYFLDAIEQAYGTRKRQKMFKWIIRMAASEIESNLADTGKDEASVEFMYEIIMRNLPKELENIPKDQLAIQLYIAIQRSLLKADFTLITYRLFINNFPDWQQADKQYVDWIVKQIDNIYLTFSKHFKNKHTETLYRWTKRYHILFILLRDLLETHQKNFSKILNSKKLLEEEIEKAYKIRLSQVQKKIRRGIVRSIIFLFFTKTFIALLLEIPYDRYINGAVELFPLMVNIIFPPLLMFLMGITIRYPAKINLEKIDENIESIIYSDKISLKTPYKSRKKSFLSIFLSILYVLTYGISFGAIMYGLYRLEFNVFSGALFILFLSLASFLGFRIRNPIKEISFIERRENILTVFIGFLTTPFLRVGNWISSKFSRVNIFIFVLDVLIEAPFQLIVEILEQWFSYMKEKKDELS